MKNKVVIIEDEPLAVSVIERYLSAHPDYEVIAVCPNGLEGLKAIRELKPDLIFLDVQMPKISGFEMLELLENPPFVIFTTAFDEYAFKAFEANALDYLLKPFDEERFARALKKYEEMSGSGNHLNFEELPAREEDKGRVVVKKGNDIIILPIGEIMYFEAYDNYVKIHTSEFRYLKKKTLNFFEQNLAEKGFIRVHRSYLINSNMITRLEAASKDQYLVILKNGEKIPASRNGYQKLKEALNL